MQGNCKFSIFLIIKKQDDYSNLEKKLITQQPGITETSEFYWYQESKIHSSSFTIAFLITKKKENYVNFRTTWSPTQQDDYGKIEDSNDTNIHSSSITVVPKPSWSSTALESEVKFHQQNSPGSAKSRETRKKDQIKAAGTPVAA
jgi:hypothetical protein